MLFFTNPFDHNDQLTATIQAISP
jgi:tetratricopeptide (TPR) repeat protein